ncbi:efflux RND transporter permease subunit [Trichothermofontia sichuanensis B231]|uniref:efflux RND transporter permease subunit n=1 Tax=Trichothermofontia sichuanensis TaxID=3045816 RepID=UPI002245B378|nr:efflux RND transporter permease subunit [Trichothermofontia sichuanensis]UZQ55518.1 efflux RND transporter permease subunit [Trichothermofontia sichuanensis B231]
MFTNFFIRRPVFASVCSLLIVLIGLVSYSRLPLQEYPSIDPPVVSVRTIYPGANPLVVETEVTEILEKEINGIEGIRTLTSESRDSVSTITIQFNLNRDLEAAAQDVRARVARVGGDLPDDAEAPVVEKEAGDASPIIWFALYGENFTPLELSNYADRFVVDALEMVPGVSSIFVGGERRYAMRLWLDPQRLAARNLTVLDVETALRQENVEIPSGRIEGATTEFSVRTLGRLQTPAEYEALVIKRNADGSQVLLRDVGWAELGAEDDRVIARFNGKPAVALGVVKLSGANTLAVAKGARAKMAELARSFPAGMAYRVAYDQAEFVQLAITEVFRSLYLAIGLVVLVIFFFLHDWRATLIPAITIPISLIGAFGVMFFLGFSINTLTLFALTLATGLVVDDTIVVLENIVRYIREKGYAPFAAAQAAMAEVVFAVIATTVVLIAVFLPVGFTGGTTGRLFNEFALTLAGAVVVSTIVALTLAPAIAARLLKAESGSSIPLLDSFFQLSEWALTQARHGYGVALRWLLGWKWVVVGGFVLALFATGIIYQQLPRGFLPVEDRGAIFIPVIAPEGVSLAYTDHVMRQIEDQLQQVPEVESYFTLAGFSFGAPLANSGFAFTRLIPWSERTAPHQSQQAVVGRLFGGFMQISDALVFPINPPSLPGVGFQQPVQYVLQGSDLDTLARVSQEFTNQARQLPQLVNVDSTLKLNKPELSLRVDRAQAANLGVAVRDIARTLQILLGGEKITSFNQNDRRYEVVVQAEKAFRDAPEDIGQFYVRTHRTGVSPGDRTDTGTERAPQAGNQLVPLSQMVTVEATTTPPKINRFNRFRAATLEAGLAPGVSLGEALAALDALAQRVLPPDMRTTLSGESLEFREAGQATLFIFGLALAFIFLVLAAQFESYLDPLIILLAVPLSLLGAFLGLWLRGLELNIFSQIGLIILIGLVTKNSILIVEFANQLRAQGLPIAQAALEASRIRFRPILMTAFSTIFGLVPLAFATGAGAASRIAIGTAVLGGMLISTLLSLFIIPVFYVIATSGQYHLLHSQPKTTKNDLEQP